MIPTLYARNCSNPDVRRRRPNTPVLTQRKPGKKTLCNLQNLEILTKTLNLSHNTNFLGKRIF